MRCHILITDSSSFPRALRPIKGRAALDYLIDDVLIQPEIKQILVAVNERVHTLISKHLSNAFPHTHFEMLPLDTLPSKYDDDVLTLNGAVHTSLKLKDFIRYYRQYKTLTKATYDKLEPKEIPFIISPKNNTSLEFHTYNCGTGYCDL